MSGADPRLRGLAQVVHLDAVRNQPAGQRGTPRRTDGHRLGDHGNRASEPMKKAVITQLSEIADLCGDVTGADKSAAADRAGVSYRTVCRWWSDELDRRVTSACDNPAARPGDGTDSAEDPRASMPRYLYRYAEPGQFHFTGDEIKFIGQFKHAKDGFAALAAIPGHRINNYSRSTWYNAWNNVSPAIRAGIKYGDKAQRAHEATYPLTGRDQVNQSWSIDEYDLKIRAGYGNAIVEPKVLIVRERLSGAPIAYTLMPRSATGTDTGVVLAAAAIGFTCPHPSDPARDLEIRGVPRLLVSDQGGSFVEHGGAAAARRLGIGLNPVASHRPQSNGDHEVMHQSLLAHFAGAGSRRGWTDRAGARLDHGVLPWETVKEEMQAWWLTQLETPYSSGPRKGRTRLEVYADAVDDGAVYHGHELTPADEAALAAPVAERSYDETRGLHHDSRYWLSPELAAAAKPSERIMLKRLLDPDVLYAFDRRDRFIGIVLPRENADIEHTHDLHADRAARQRFVEHGIAHPRAKAAQADAAAAWDEVADRLAEAADHTHDNPSDPTAGRNRLSAVANAMDNPADELVDNQADAPLDGQVDGQAEGAREVVGTADEVVQNPTPTPVKRQSGTSDRDYAQPVRTTRRRRKTPAADNRPDHGLDDGLENGPDDDNSVAALYLRNRKHHHQQQQHQQQPADGRRSDDHPEHGPEDQHDDQ